MNKKGKVHTDSAIPFRILQVTGRMYRGGAETIVMNVYRNINRSNIQFDFVTFNKEDGDYHEEIRKLGGRIYYIPKPQESGVFRFIYNLTRLIKVNGPYKALHAHTLFNIGLALTAARISGVKCRISHSHSTKAVLKDSLVQKAYRVIMRALIIINATSLVACSRGAGQYLYGNIFKLSGIVLPNAVDISEYSDLNETDGLSLRQSFEIPHDCLIIGQVGTLKPVKNHEYSISIASELKKSGRNFRMIFVGDGDMRSELEEKARIDNVAEYILFLGIRTDIPQLMNMFDLLIMPSLFEGLPVTLVEAQAAGIPCLVSDVITREADLGLGLISFLSLESGLDNWKHFILEDRLAHQCNRKEIINAFKIRGYDIFEGVKRLQKLYEY